MENIIISDKDKLEKLKKSISLSGPEKFHIRTDFDRTLTTAFVDGKSIPSIISVLRDGEYLTPDYAKEAHGLYEKYHPIEIDQKIPPEEKRKAMLEWWQTHFDLLIRSGLNKKHIKSIVEADKVKFRGGFSEFSDFLHKNNIPLLIISSGGLGGDTIPIYLKKEGKLYDNVYIISNLLEWGKEGNAVSVKKPIIHIMNKDETAIEELPVFNAIKERKNVLLLGDSLDDLGMVKGFDCENLIKIGFFNEKSEENLEYYKANFDAVILNDSSLEYVNNLLAEIFPF